MDIFSILTLLGGLAMFLYGMRIMGDGLKASSSGALKNAMEKMTGNPVKAFLLGVAFTAVIQSSTATIVITSGLVAAGILTLHQSLGIIIGANVGTTVTGQIIRLLDLDTAAGSWLQIFKPSTLAPVALIIGIVLIMFLNFRNSKTVGNIAIGFGILFTGLLNMTGAVDSLAGSGIFESLLTGLDSNPVLGYLTGAGVAFVLQSSSATIGILQAFSQSGLLVFKGVYAVIVGIYLGDCVTTAIVCSIGAKPEARRVGIVNILFNLSETVVVLIGVAIIHRTGLLDGLWARRVDSSIIANTNTIFNLSCAILLFPMIGVYEKLSRRIVRDEAVKESKYKEKLDSLNPAFYRSPAIALNSCYDVLLTMFDAARVNLWKAMEMLTNYSEETMAEIEEDEAGIDEMTDRTSRYIVGLLPKLTQKEHIAILDEYYRVVTEFERLGDNAVNIARVARAISDSDKSMSEAAKQEMAVLMDLLKEILDDARQAFEKRDVEAAYRIEPLEEVTDEFISALKVNHLNRMSSGECDVVMDSYFMNLLSDVKRIAGICSNVGVATVIRVRPELADQKHSYFTSLRSGNDEAFNAEYERARSAYFDRLEAIA